MSARRVTLLVLILVAVASPRVSAHDIPEAFLEVDASDFTSICLDDGGCFGPAGRFYYNRVDGMNFYLGVRYRSETRLHPRVLALWGWPSSRSGSMYQLKFEQPLLDQNSLSFGVGFYDKTSESRQDSERIQDLDNNLRAFSARRDLRDYFTTEGGNFFVNYIVTPELTFRLEYKSENLTSLDTVQSVWTLFRRNEEWRENPPLMVGVEKGQRLFEGKMKSWVGSFEYDTRDEFEYSGWRLRGFYTYSGQKAGGDYDFRRIDFDVMPYWRITETQTLTLKAWWGLASGTDYPSQELFYLGGIENMAGYGDKEFAAKNVFWGRVEYGVHIWEEFEVIYYGDLGEAWNGSTGFDASEILYDLGIGFRWDFPGLGDFRIDAAHALDDGRDLQVDFRLYVY